MRYSIRIPFFLAVFLGTLLVACSGGEKEGSSATEGPAVAVEQAPEEQAPEEQAPAELAPEEQEPIAQEVKPSMSDALAATLAALSEEDRSRPNPLAGQPEASARGGEEFGSLCAHCHGKSGKGDGPASKALGVSPGNLSTSRLRVGERYQVLKRGVPGTAMQGFGAAMSDNQIWQLITYMDTLRPTEEAAEEPTTETEEPPPAP